MSRTMSLSALLIMLLLATGCDMKSIALPKAIAASPREQVARRPSSNLGNPEESRLATSEEGIDCFFSPEGGCTEAVVDELAKAQKTILVQAYSFTSAPIAKALVEAHKRGVKITVILDKSQQTEKYSEADFVAHMEIPCFIDDKHAIAHNKIMLIDGHTIITGSFNFTKQAEQSNAENLLVIHDRPTLYAAYEANFKLHLGHSERYAGKPE